GPASPRLGFVTAPSPNPSRAGVRFTYALESPGRARADVFDVRGRRVAVLVDHVLAAGTYQATWHGAGRAGAGFCSVRLRLQGFAGTRRLVIAPCSGGPTRATSATTPTPPPRSRDRRGTARGGCPHRRCSSPRPAAGRSGRTRARGRSRGGRSSRCR